MAPLTPDSNDSPNEAPSANPSTQSQRLVRHERSRSCTPVTIPDAVPYQTASGIVHQESPSIGGGPVHLTLGFNSLTAQQTIPQQFFPRLERNRSPSLDSALVMSTETSFVAGAGSSSVGLGHQHPLPAQEADPALIISPGSAFKQFRQLKEAMFERLHIHPDVASFTNSIDSGLPESTPDSLSPPSHQSGPPAAIGFATLQRPSPTTPHLYTGSSLPQTVAAVAPPVSAPVQISVAGYRHGHHPSLSAWDPSDTMASGRRDQGSDGGDPSARHTHSGSLTDPARPPQPQTVPSPPGTCTGQGLLHRSHLPPMAHGAAASTFPWGSSAVPQWIGDSYEHGYNDASSSQQHLPQQSPLQQHPSQQYPTPNRTAHPELDTKDSPHHCHSHHHPQLKTPHEVDIGMMSGEEEDEVVDCTKDSDGNCASSSCRTEAESSQFSCQLAEVARPHSSTRQSSFLASPTSPYGIPCADQPHHLHYVQHQQSIQPHNIWAPPLHRLSAAAAATAAAANTGLDPLPQAPFPRLPLLDESLTVATIAAWHDGATCGDNNGNSVDGGGLPGQHPEARLTLTSPQRDQDGLLQSSKVSSSSCLLLAGPAAIHTGSGNCLSLDTQARYVPARHHAFPGTGTCGRQFTVRSLQPPQAYRAAAAATVARMVGKGMPFVVLAMGDYSALCSAALEGDLDVVRSILMDRCYAMQGSKAYPSDSKADLRMMPRPASAATMLALAGSGGNACAAGVALGADSGGLLVLCPAEYERISLAAEYDSPQLREMLCLNMGISCLAGAPSVGRTAGGAATPLRAAVTAATAAAAAAAGGNSSGVSGLLCFTRPSPTGGVSMGDLQDLGGCTGSTARTGSDALNSAGSGFGSGTVAVNPLRLLIRAAQLGNVHLVLQLLEHGVDVNAVEPGTQRTALHYAAECGSWLVAYHLIHHGAFMGLRDKAAKTPLKLARRKRHWAISQLIKDVQATRKQEVSRGHAVEMQHAVRVSALASKGPSAPEGRLWHTLRKPFAHRL